MNTLKIKYPELKHTELMVKAAILWNESKEDKLKSVSN